jgi:D-alanyl-D-alanine carboxypeptidase (penicillin-binding protein 5/6)
MPPALRSALAAATAAAVMLPVMMLGGNTAADASPSRPAGPAGVLARSAELVDVSTGKWLWSRGMNTKHPIASITKIMTAMVVIQSGNLNRRIRVTSASEQYARDYNATSADLVPGDRLTARELLEGLLLPSGADAAYLLASAYGPGWHAFVKKMNAGARRLGMTETHFANFDGLPWPTPASGYSSPRDLIKMGEAALKVPLIREIVDQHSYTLGGGAQHHKYYWKNTNLLLGHFSGAMGIKTGYTTAAGYCLLFAATRGGRELMGVVLDSTTTNPSARFTAAKLLLTWGFTVTKPKPPPPPSPAPTVTITVTPEPGPTQSTLPIGGPSSAPLND